MSRSSNRRFGRRTQPTASQLPLSLSDSSLPNMPVSLQERVDAINFEKFTSLRKQRLFRLRCGITAMNEFSPGSPVVAGIISALIVATTVGYVIEHHDKSTANAANTLLAQSGDCKAYGSKTQSVDVGAVAIQTVMGIARDTTKDVPTANRCSLLNYASVVADYNNFQTIDGGQYMYVDTISGYNHSNTMVTLTLPKEIK